MSGVAGRSGRKPKSMQRATTSRIITDASPTAALYLKMVSLGKVKRPSPIRVEVCRYIVDQDIGRATQRIEHKAPPSAPLSYDDIVKSAEAKRRAEDIDRAIDQAEDILVGDAPAEVETPDEVRNLASLQVDQGVVQQVRLRVVAAE